MTSQNKVSTTEVGLRRRNYYHDETSMSKSRHKCPDIIHSTYTLFHQSVVNINTHYKLINYYTTSPHKYIEFVAHSEGI